MILRDLLVRTGTRASESMERLNKILRLKRSGARQLELVSMEDRLLFSAAPGPMPVAPAPDAQMVMAASLDAPVEIIADASAQPDGASTTEAQGLQPLGVLDVSTGGVLEAPSRELVFIDTGAENYQQLLDDLWSHQDPNRQVDVVLLSAGEDGLTQITETLAQYQTEKLDAVHFVTHGADRAIKLGNTWLDAESLDANRDRIASWGEALKPGADLLIYGCDLAGNDLGRALLNNLVDLTGADIAASIDDTGSTLLGGNWDLEYELGAVETDVVFSELTQQEYDGLLTAFSVTNTNDSGAGSLRQAIINANGLAGTDSITFSALGAGTHTINLASALTVSSNILLDGKSAIGYASTPLIQLNAAGVGSFSNALILDGASDNSIIQGLSIYSMSNGNGIQMNDATGVVIRANYIGLKADGTVAGNSTGIVIGNSSNITIGGTTAADRNVITGNLDGGIRLESSTSGVQIQGNYIGTNAAGTLALGNGSDGVYITGSSGNTVGGTVAGARNVISGNSINGVRIDGFGSTGNSVIGNYIGTDFTGLLDRGNGEDGIEIQNGASNNIIGGLTAAERNVISGNDNAGIAIDGSTSSGNTILGNTIGLGSDGMASLGNTHDGVHLQGATNTVIGSTNAGGRNLISGNAINGIGLDGTTGTTIQGNYIGLDVTGTLDRGNAGPGVRIYNGANNNAVGAAGGGRNVISGNNSYGVEITGANASNNRIYNNYIGLNAAGTSAVGNSGDGVHVETPLFTTLTGTIIGGTTGLGNVISGNAGDGIEVFQNATNVTIQGNTIGLNAAGTAAVANSGRGIYTVNADNTTIGGGTSDLRNIISGNGTNGIQAESASGMVIKGNYIGSDVTGSVDLGNGLQGIAIGNSMTSTTIGGLVAGEGNLIRGNGEMGIRIYGSGTSSNLIAGNIITANASDGIATLSSAGTGNRFSRNAIFANVDQGIDLNYETSAGVTANDPGDGDALSNNTMNFPVIYSVVIVGGNVTITGEARSGATVEFFEAVGLDSNGEGQIFIGSGTVSGFTSGTIDSTARQFSFTFAVGSLVSGDRVTATATDGSGNTSEFAANVTAKTPGITVTPTTGLTTTEAGGTASFTVVMNTAPTSGVSIQLGSTDTTEGTISGATLVGNTLTFTTANWSTPQTITVTGVNDSLSDGDISYTISTLSATSSDSNYNGINPSDVSVTNVDNDLYSISGTIYEDVDGDGQVSDDGVGLANAIVSLYRDDGDGVLDAGDTILISLLANGSGQYTFSGLSTDTYWVVADSRSFIGTGGLNGGYTIHDQWAEQTYGSAGSVGWNGSAYTFTGTAGAFFGGMRQDRGDNGASLLTGEHVTRVAVAAANVTGIDTGFSYNVITNTRDGDEVGANNRTVQGSLRQFIQNSNALAGTQSTNFEITDPLVSGAHTINVASALPTITGAVIIDGTTDVSFASNSNRPVIILDGNNTFIGDGLVLSSTADGSTIRGLVIRDFSGDGIQINSGSSGNTIAGNYIGRFDATGSAVVGEDNTGAGVLVLGNANTIGGPGTLDRNVISGNILNGVTISGAAASGNTVQGNYIGTDAAGTAAIGNSGDGIYVMSGASNAVLRDNVVSGNLDDGIEITGLGSGHVVRGNIVGLNASGTAALANQDHGVVLDDGVSGTTIGGSTAAERNVISGNAGRGIIIDGNGGVDTINNVVIGNYIGTDVSGTLARGNGNDGIRVIGGALNNRIGGTTVGEGNLIAYNDSSGVELSSSSSGISILGNRFFSNSKQAIDLSDDDVTLNDAGDADTGANGLQNFPVIYSVLIQGGNVTIIGEARPGSLVEFYKAAVDSSAYGEGQTFIGRSSVTGTIPGTVDSTARQFSFTFAIGSLIAGDKVTATSTVDLGAGNYGSTSEFSANVLAQTSLAPKVLTSSTSTLYAVGGETRINTTTTDIQYNFSSSRTIAADGQGNFVTVWSSNLQDGSGYGVYGQRFTREGAPLGGEFQVSTTSSGDQDAPFINMTSDGRFVVTWESAGQDGSGGGVYARIYDAAGTPVSGEIQVNTVTANDQAYPVIGINDNGNFVIAWQSTNQDGQQGGVYAQRFNSAGTKLGSEFRVNTTTANDQSLPNIDMNSAGDFVIVWRSGHQDTANSYGVYAQRYNASGVAQGGEILVNTYTAGDQDYAAVTLADNGQFTVVWESATQDAGTYGVYGQVFNATGTKIGTEFRVNSTSSDNQWTPCIDGDALGNFTVVWSSNLEDGSGWGAYSQRYDNFGNPLGVNVLVNSTTLNNQKVPSVTMQPGGDLVVMFSGNGVGDADGVFFQRYALRTIEAGGTTVVNVQLASAPTSNVIIPISSSNLAEGTVGTSSLTFTPGNWDVAQSVTLTGVSDGLVDGTQSYNLVLGTLSSNDTAFSGVNPSDVLVINVDDNLVHTVIVDTTADTNDTGLGSSFTMAQLMASKGTDGKISLREALIAANNTINDLSGPDRILFNITDPLVSGAHTIDLSSALPTITGSVIIDASTDANYAGTPIVVINGVAAGSTTNGLTISANDSMIRGLALNRFGGDSILITGDRNTIAGNYIGTDVTGLVDLGTGDDGISITGADNVIGGATTADRNVIVGQSDDAIEVTGTADNTRIQGNYIGVGADGTTAVMNSVGIFASAGATNLTIGGSMTGEGNVIGQHNVGVWLVGVTNSTIAGNRIGTNAAGTAGYGVGQGVLLMNSSIGNTIGGATAASRNVVSGTASAGINIDSTSSGNTIAFNYIGTDASGMLDLGNSGAGLSIASSTNTVRNNLISGNALAGVRIDGATATGNVVAGNLIGVNAIGTGNLGNDQDGVILSGGASNNTIGGTFAADRNVISGNNEGIVITGSATTLNVVQGNYIGTDVTGTLDRGNTNSGVGINSGASNNTIGGTTAGAGNVISGNDQYGVAISGASTNSNLVQGNLIGLDAGGTADLGNLWSGVFVGTGATNTLIGGSATMARNVISGNDMDGIELSAAGTGTAIQGNYVGSNEAGTAGVGNASRGIVAHSGSSALIGGTNAGEGNLIAYHTASGGVAVLGFGAPTTFTSILGNSLHSNTRLGIDLQDNNVTLNDAGDTDVGANGLQNFPVLSDALTTGTSYGIAGSLNSTSGTTFRIEFFSSPTGDGTGYGEGRTFLGYTTITTDASGNASFAETFTGTLTAGHVVSATATVDLGGGNYGSTSEFAANVTATVAVAANTAPVLGSSSVLNSINEDDITNSGTLVSQLVDTEVTDADAGALKGIAIVAADTTNGSWQYTLDGTSWLSLGTPSTAAARLLAADSTTRVRFVPNANWNGTLPTALAYHAWDQTSGINGGTASVAPATVADSFSVVSYANNNGTANWTGAWTETDNNGGGASGGLIRVISNQLQVQSDRNNDNVYRQVDLSGTASATLSFSYQSTISGGLGDVVRVQVSGNGGGSYTTLATFNNTTNTGSGNLSFDISSFIASNTRIRFIVTSVDVTAPVNFDNVQISYGTSTGGQTAFSSSSASSSIVVNAVNDAPSITLASVGGPYIENGTPALFDTAPTITDPDSNNFDTGTLTASIESAGTVDDRITIRNQGTGVGQIGVSGNDVTYQNVIIGTWTGGTSGSTPLVVTLNSQATLAAVQALAGNIQFSSVSDNPSTTSRLIRIVVTDGDGGTSNNGQNLLAVTAVNDAPSFFIPAFDGDGKLTTAIGPGNDSGYSVTVQADGKILVGGKSYNGSNYDFALVRYNTDGSLDTSFDGDGKLTTAIGSSDDSGDSVTVQADGKILVGGYSYNGSNYDFALVRYNTDGSLDTSFDGDGKLTTAIGSSDAYGNSVTVQADGKILVAGISHNGSNWDFALVRYNTDGSLDTSFDGDGKLTTAIGSSNDRGYSVAVQADGKILVGGESFNGSTYDFALVRYNTNGSLDTSFDGDGKLTTTIGSSDGGGNSVTVQADGKILVGGSSFNGSSFDFALVRYNTDGSLDTSFDGDGKLTTAIGSGNDWGNSVTVQADGKILVGGYSYNGSDYDFALVRYNTDGSLDTGSVISTLDGTPTYTENGAAVVLDGNVQIFDAELSAANNFSGATLTLVRNGGANSQDLFSATGTLSTLTQGGSLVVGGTTIGTVTTNSTGTLLLTFNSNATNSLVNSAMQQIAYSNSSDNPPASVQINWTFNDQNSGAQGTGGALSATGSTTVTITATNDAPTARNGGVPDIDAVEGTTFSLPASAGFQDADGDVLTYIITGLPSGLTYDNTTGLISGTIPIGASTSGPYTITVSATDGFAPAVVDTFTLRGHTVPTLSHSGVWTPTATGGSTTAGSVGISVDMATDIGGSVTAPFIETLSSIPAFSDDTRQGAPSLRMTFNWDATPELGGDPASADAVAGQLTINFSQAVTNPILHLDRLGGYGDWIWNSMRMTLQTAGVTLEEIAGTASFDVNSSTGTIERTSNVLADTDGSASAEPSTNWNKGTAAGSVRLIGTFTSLKFLLEVVPGNVEGAGGDGFEIAFSLNEIPVAADNAYATSENTSLSGNVLTDNTGAGVDSDPEGDSLSVSAVNGVTGDVGRAITLPSGATLTVNSDGSYLYDPGNAFDDLAAGATTNDSFTYTVTDPNGGVNTATVAFTITGINDAPNITASTNINLTATDEDSPSTPVLVSTLLGTAGLGYADVDTGALPGLAVTAATGGGNWQYSTDGSAWVNVVGVSTTNALLLDGSTQLRFNPDGQNGSSATIVFRAWDQTSGTASTNGTPAFADPAGGGSATAFSSSTANLLLSVTSVNDAPQIVAASPLNGIREDEVSNTGTLISQLISTAIMDVDAGAVKGIAITDLPQTNGTWEYTLNGTTWISAGTPSTVAALLLPADATTAIRFVPNADVASSSGLMTYRAWDQTTGTAGGTADVTTSGGTTAFSTGANGSSVGITPINDAPVLTAGTVSNLTVAEDSGFTSLGLSGVTYGPGGGTDEASQTLTYAVTSIPGSSIGDIYLADGTTKVVVGPYSLSQIQGMQFKPANNATGTTGFQFNVYDNGGVAFGGSDNISQFMLITVNAVNDAPTVTITSPAFAYAENGVATAIDPTLTVSDIDSANLTGATVTISGNYANGQDVLAFTDQLGITGSWSASTGVLTLSGTTTKANYQTALRSVTYFNNSENPSVLTRTISVVASDATLSSAAATRDITVTAVNDAPAIVTNALSISEGATVVLSGTQINTTDLDNTAAQLTYTASSISGGQFEFVASGGTAITSFTQAQINSNLVQFVHNGGEAAPAYSLTVSDGSLVAGPQSAAISFTNVNDLPVAIGASGSADEGVSPVGIMLFGSDTDGTVSSIRVATLPATGTLFADSGLTIPVVVGVDYAATTNARLFYFLPPSSDWNSSTGFTYSVVDNSGAVSASTANATISVTAVNDAPAITTNTLTISEGATVVLSGVQISATDPDNTPTQLTYTVSGLSGGQLEFVATAGTAITSFTQADINSNLVQFVHNGGETAPAYSLTVSDGSLSAAPQAAAISFTNANDAPTIATNALTISEGGTVVLSNSSINATDPDNTPAELTYSVSGLSGGQFELVASGGTAISSFTQAQINAGAVQFVHNGGEAAPSYQLTVSDGSLSNGPSTVSLGSFSNINDAPSLGASTLLNGITEDDITNAGTLVSVLVDTEATDPDAGALKGIAVTVTTLTNGAWEYTLNGADWFSIGSRTAATALLLPADATTRIRFVPNANFTGNSGSLIYLAWDRTTGTAGSTADTTMRGGTTAFSALSNSTSVTVSPANDGPSLVTNTLSINEGATVVLSGTQINTSDPDNTSDQLTYTVSGLSGGQFEFVAAPGTAITSFTQAQINTGAVQFVHNGGEAAPAYSLTVSDGSLVAGPQSAAISFTNVNDLPVAIGASSGASEGISPVGISLGGSDLDGTITAIRIATLPATGTLYADSALTIPVVVGVDYAATTNARLFYFLPPSADWNGSTGFTFSVVDNSGAVSSSTANATINVTAVNDAPVVTLSAVPIDFTENSPVGIMADLTVTDIDSPTLTSATITLTTNFVSTEDQLVFTDMLGVTGSYSSATGVLTLNGAATLADYQTALRSIAYFNTSDNPSTAQRQFTVTLSDGASNSSAVTRAININAVNDSPTISVIANQVVNEDATLGPLNFTVNDPDTGSLSVTAATSDGALIPLANIVLAGSGMTRTVTITPALNQTGGPVTITLTVSDGSLTSQTSFDVTINAINDVPTISPATFSLDENSSLGTIVGDVTTTDPDVADTTTFTITAGNGSSGGAFSIDSTGRIRVADAAQLDFETTPIWSLTVQVSDAAGATASTTITINLRDLNDHTPVITSNGGGSTAAFLVAENTTTVTIVSATDADAVSTVRYTFYGDDAGLFSIDSNTGVLSFNTAPDFENPLDADLNNVYQVTVVAYDEDNRNDSQDLTITVKDVNEFATTAINDTDLTTESVAENAGVGTLVGVTALADDLDGTDIVSYSLLDDAGGRFAVNPISGVVTVATSLDYEAATSHTIRVEARSTDGSTSVRDFAITVIDVNESAITPISDTNLTAEVLNENHSVGTPVGVTAFADDLDGTDSVSYSLLDNAGGLFVIDSTTGVVTLNAALDYETSVSHTIRVQAFSTDGSAVTRDFTFSVLDVNESAITPVSDQDLATDTVAESAVIGTAVGVTAFANDLDGTDTISYSLLSNPGGLFAIDAATGAVTVAAALDYETSTSHTIRVEARSTDGTASVRDFTIAVTDVNEFAASAISDIDGTSDIVSENAGVGTVVGVTAFADDLDGTDTVAYSLTNDAGGRLAIDAASGVVTVAGAIDYEATTTLAFTVQATSTDGSVASRDFVIAVTDVNDNAPVITSGQTLIIAENSPNGLSVGTVMASDVDSVGTSQGWAITGGTGAGAFAINPATGEITVQNSALLDFETSPSFTLLVSVSDGVQTSAVRTVTINLSNVNEAPQITGPSDTTIGEDGTSAALPITISDVDTAANSLVVTASSSDQALIPNGNIVVAGTGTNRTVTISPTANLSGGPVTITLTVSDGTLFSQTTFQVTVTAVNDAPMITLISDQVINEDTSTGPLAFTVNDIDSDVNALTVTATSDNQGLIPNGNVVVSGTGANRTITVTPAANQNGGSVTITLTVSDGGLTSQQIFTVDVLPVNDLPTISPQGFAVNENSVTGTVVGTVVASDIDAGAVLTYAIDSGNSNGAFAIDAATGQITVANATALDFEATPQYLLIVSVTDSVGTPQTATMTIRLLDLNEVPTSLSLSNASASENSPVGTPVGTLSSTDVDAGDSATYSLVDDAGGLFAVDSNTGEITVNGALDFETSANHTIIARVTDGGGLVLDRSFVISLVDINEAPVLVGGAFGLPENRSNGTLVGTVSASDVDAGDQLTFSLLSGNTGGAFSMDANTGAIIVANTTSLDFESNGTFTLTVQVADRVGLTHQQLVTVTLSDVNERPTVLAGTYHIDEWSSIGSLVGLVAASDVDASDTLTYSFVAGNTGGRFAIDPSTGNITVANSANFTYESQSSYTISVQVQDAAGLIHSADMLLLVDNVNDPPVAVDDQYTANQFKTLTTTTMSGVLANDSDRDSAFVTASLVLGPQHGTLAFNADGTFTYVSDRLYFGLDSFTYLVNDGLESSSVATVSLTVNLVAPGGGGLDSEPLDDLGDAEITDTEEEADHHATDEQPAVSGESSNVTGGTSTSERSVPIPTDSTTGGVLPPTMDILEGFFHRNSSLFDLRSGVRHSSSSRSGLGNYVRRLPDVLPSIQQFIPAPLQDLTLAILKNHSMWNELNTIRHQMETGQQSSVFVENIVVGTTTAVTGGLTVGYVIWLIRGGSLLATMVSVIPTWASFDPLPVMDRFEEEKSEEDKESLASIVSGA